MINRLCWAFLFQKIGLAIWVNYGLVHLITLGFGYSYHTLITFRRKMSIRGFWKFVLSVIVLRIVDYILVIGSNQLNLVRNRVYEIPSVGEFLGDNLFFVSIAFVSGIMFIIRYTLFRKVTFADKGASDKSGVSPSDHEGYQE